MILSALCLFAAVVEIFLFVGKDYLLDTRRRAALESSLRQAYADLQEAKSRIAAKREVLLAAIDDAERQRVDLHEADKAFARSQKIMPTLIHTLGDPNTGMRFRAPIAKMLPATPDRSQQVIWQCNNFVDVWAHDVQSARQMVDAQFRVKHDYDVGEFVPMPPEDSAVQRGKAA